MNIRVQLVANSPLHTVPSIILNIHRTQFVFNVIPTLLRHRANHRLNLFNSCHIFFTKNSVEAFGGFSNYLLFRIGSQISNAVTANKINIFMDQQVFNYMQKLRFKLGYKILRVSYCDWKGEHKRYGINKLEMVDKIKTKPQFFSIFANIEQYLRQNSKTEDFGYYDCSRYLKSRVSQDISISCPHYSSDLVNIYPIMTCSGDIKFTHYICIPTQMIKRKDVNIEQLKAKAGIIKQQQIKRFIKQGFIKKDDKIIRKEQYLFKQNYKPKNVLILHHSSLESLQQLTKHQIMINYLQNKRNQTALVIHILQDVGLINTVCFKNFIARFDKQANHLWYNRQFNVQQSIESKIGEQSHLIELQLLSLTFPSVFRDLLQQRLSYYSNQKSKIIQSVFPLLKNHYYRRLYNYIKNDYVGDSYEQKILPIHVLGKADILKQLFEQQKETVKQIQSQCSTCAKKSNKQSGKTVFLGTASSMPTASRNTLGILVSLCNKVNFLLDCGQGSYEQLVDHFAANRFQEELIKLRVIFITHIHSDHNLGILNLIHERNKLLQKYGLKQRLFLIIPFNVYNWYISYCNTVEKLSVGCDVLFTQVLLNELQQPVQQLNQKIQIDRLPKGFLSKKNNKQQNYCFKKNSDPQSYSQLQLSVQTKYLVDKQMPFQSAKLQQFGLFLKQNCYSQFLPVRVIHCPQSFGIIICHQNGYKLSYSGDTRPSADFARKAQNSTLMIHEATFNDSQHAEAVEFRHCTVEQAVRIGYESRSSMLAVTHFNQKFKDPTSNINYSKEFKNYFHNNTIFSHDHLQIDLSRMECLPRVTHLITKFQARAREKAQSIKNEVRLQIDSHE